MFVIGYPRYTTMQTLDDKGILAVEFRKLGLDMGVH